MRYEAMKGNKFAKGNKGGGKLGYGQEEKIKKDLNKKWGKASKVIDEVIANPVIDPSIKLQAIKIILNKLIPDKRSSTVDMNVNVDNVAEEEVDSLLKGILNGRKTSKNSRSKEGSTKVK